MYTSLLHKNQSEIFPKSSFNCFLNFTNPFHPSVAFLIATSHLICSANAIMAVNNAG